MTKAKKTSALKEALTAVAEAPGKPSFENGLSSGSTMLNLALTGLPDYGWLPGFYYLLIGDSNSGKTFEVMTLLAEASLNPFYANYRLIYDASERGALMDMKRLYGQALVDRMEPPYKDKQGNPVYSSTVEEFYFFLDEAMKAGPCIYIQDSENGLSSEADVEKFDKNKQAHFKGKEQTGSYGTKPKVHSGNLNHIVSKLSKTGSMLFMVSQSRDNIGPNAMFKPKTRSGGRALSFFACCELWFSVKEKIKKNVRDKKRQVGILSQVKVTRNRFTGRERSVELPIHFDYGIDDVGSMVDWLIDEGFWQKKEKGIIVTGEPLKLESGKEGIIAAVEEQGLEKQLKSVVLTGWDEIEEACELQRKPRYG